VNDEGSLKSRVMVMVMVRITIRIANPNRDPAGCGLTLTLTAQQGYSFQNSPRHGAKVGYCPVYHFEKQNN